MPLRLPLAEYNRELGPSPFQTLGSVDFYQVPTDLVNLVRHHLILIDHNGGKLWHREMHTQSKISTCDTLVLGSHTPQLPISARIK
jgi:hypothetical protein|eukprot:COSAG01_NODE_11996_length_1819_cov_32.463953_3_plen_86_part_00